MCIGKGLAHTADAVKGGTAKNYVGRATGNAWLRADQTTANAKQARIKVIGAVTY